MSLFSELKRRNVFRVGAAYVALSWLIIQVAETILPAFDFGGGAGGAVILAGAFELTPEGLKRDHEVDRSSPPSGSMSASRMQLSDERVIRVATPHNRRHEQNPDQ